MKQGNAAKGRKKAKMPLVRKDPRVFETAFQKRLGQSPIDYLVGKIQSGSSIPSIEYLFDIVSAEIAAKDHCTYKGFAYYYTKAQERINAIKNIRSIINLSVTGSQRL